MGLLSAATSENLLKTTGGVTVVKGAQTTYGHLQRGPVEVLGADGRTAVLTADARVVIADGLLTGVGPDDGIGEAIKVDGVDYTIVGIQQPDGEPDGEMLQLVIKKERKLMNPEP